MTKFGRLVREKREEKDLSLSEVAAAMTKAGENQISRSQLCLIESGARIVTLKIASALSKTLDIDVQSAISAAYADRITHACIREKKALETFTKKNRLGKKLDLRKVIN